MKKLTSFVLMAVFAAFLSGTVAAQERGEHRRGGEHRGAEKRSEQGKMSREDAIKKFRQLREKMNAKRGSEKPVVGRKGCECSCHKKATKKSEKRTQERRHGRGRGRGRTDCRREGGSRWGRGRTLLHWPNRA